MIQYFYIYNVYYDKKENVLCFLFPGTAGRSLRKEEQPVGETHAPWVALALVGAALIVVAVILCADVPRDTEIQRRTITDNTCIIKLLTVNISKNYVYSNSTRCVLNILSLLEFTETSNDTSSKVKKERKKKKIHKKIHRTKSTGSIISSILSSWASTSDSDSDDEKRIPDAFAVEVESVNLSEREHTIDIHLNSDCNHHVEDGGKTDMCEEDHVGESEIQKGEIHEEKDEKGSSSSTSSSESDSSKSHESEAEENESEKEPDPEQLDKEQEPESKKESDPEEEVAGAEPEKEEPDPELEEPEPELEEDVAEPEHEEEPEPEPVEPEPEPEEEPEPEPEEIEPEPEAEPEPEE